LIGLPFIFPVLRTRRPASSYDERLQAAVEDLFPSTLNAGRFLHLDEWPRRRSGGS
jgi:hypothetical protein